MIVSKTKQQASSDVAKTEELLADLGFVIHPHKSVVVPMLEITFWGFVLMKVMLPQPKVKEIKAVCSKLLSSDQHTIRYVATALRKTAADFPAVQYGKLHYKELEKDQIKALKSQHGHFDRPMVVPQFAKEDVAWWLYNVESQHRNIKIEKHSMTITSDASSMGWGASDGKFSTGGRWSPLEKCRAANNEINYLEMLAAFLTLQAFCKTKGSMHVRLRLDHTTAVAYINNMGCIQPESSN